MKRGQKLFDDAGKVINGDRQTIYGDPEDSFVLIAERWTQYLAGRGLLPPGFDSALAAADVAFMMMDLKMARHCTSPKRDNLVDVTGYAGILDDIDAAGSE